MKKCTKCKKEFEPKDELDMFCSQTAKKKLSLTLTMTAMSV